MSFNAVEFHCVTKRYSRYAGLLRVKNFLDRLKNGQIASKLVREPDFYALRDVSFTIKHGEKVGIIGSNGAGKSTSLKLIQGVTSPTSGKVIVRGRVSGLIELGTGFHADLTGRENVYLNTAINGLSRAETDALFDQILQIAEIGHYIDVPLKRYSSGMKVRLGFAVSMVFAPDIVLLDEVLAVGDVRFREKSMRMIKEHLDGRTLVFVSHSMGVVKKVCDRVIVLNRGEIAYDGPTAEGVKTYMSLQKSRSDLPQDVLIQQKVKRGFADAPSIKIEAAEFAAGDAPVEREPDVTVRLKFNVLARKGRPVVRVEIKRVLLDRHAELVGGIAMRLEQLPGDGDWATLTFDASKLRPGSYVLEVTPRLSGQSSKSALVLFRKPFTVAGEEPKTATGVVDLGFHLAFVEPSGSEERPHLLLEAVKL